MSNGLFVVVTAELAHDPGMPTLLFQTGVCLMNGGLCFAGPHAASMKSKGRSLEAAELKVACEHPLSAEFWRGISSLPLLPLL